MLCDCLQCSFRRLDRLPYHRWGPHCDHHCIGGIGKAGKHRLCGLTLSCMCQLVGTGLQQQQQIRRLSILQNCKLSYSVPAFPFLPSISMLLNALMMVSTSTDVCMGK